MTLFSYLYSSRYAFSGKCPLMWLWNITIPRIFNVREITYWEAFRLIIIAGILFGRDLALISVDNKEAFLNSLR